MSKGMFVLGGVNRKCSCNTVTEACAVRTNGLCGVNKWYHHDCVTRSNILDKTQVTPKMFYARRTITEGDSRDDTSNF